jgi:hypothetical protein
MRRLSTLICAVVAVLAVPNAAWAQSVLPGGSLFNPPLPPPPAPPRIEAPVVPQIDAPLRQDYRPVRRPSFSDRITNCLEQGAAAGLDPADRAAYSRSCANQ